MTKLLGSTARRFLVVLLGVIAAAQPLSAEAPAQKGAPDLWQLAHERQDVHRFSTLVTASQVRDLLSTDRGIDDAIDWCKRTAVTKVYVESFRSDYQAERDALVRARDRLRAAGLEVSGCVTTTIVGKRSTGWNLISCYTDRPTQERVAEIFRFTAELFGVAEEVGKRELVGVAAYKPPNSHPENEPRVFDFVGMTGVPLVPCHEFPAEAQAAFFSVHALKDVDLPEKLTRFVAAGKPVLVTDGLADRLAGRVDLKRPNVRILPVGGSPKSLLELEQAKIDPPRARLLAPLGRSFRAPNRVSLCLFADGSWVVQNFNDEPANVELDGKPIDLDARAWRYAWR